ncbi:polyprotein [Chrysochromulina tobinii]|uniref:Polyprotein n=1 Tax=Chrysochromulina tobinii TaxID=1460289 RepID=A0A0M0JWR9_9EUKA|nr:polyprotein [Chrysochromulina tobinii]|eukprot:KOO30772.1 polyprotein [Chrysochromulina sp. CCMP291]
MIAVKRALKFDDQAEAPDVLESEADSERSERESESDADEHAEPATDWDTFWTRKPTRDMIRTLSSQEVESNKTDLTVARLDEWMLKFMAFARRRYPQFGELLEIVWTLADLEEATSLVTTSVLASDANLWGASALMSVIDVTKPAGKVFKTAMLDAERAIAGTMSSGIEIAVRIAKLLKDRHTGDEEADYLKFEAKQYLKLGQDENSIRIAFGMIKSDLSICPKRIREAPHAYLRWLLKKAPTEIAKKCKEIEHQINVAERRQVEPMFNSELLTVDVLTYEMIEMISAASKENQISIVEVAAADKKRKLSAERVKLSKNPPCANCGSTEHGWGDCKATTLCGLKFCQCARSMACWVDADVMPTKDELKTAQGRNLPDSLINKLKETRKGKNKQVSAVEILGDLGAKPMLGAQTDGMLGLALDDLPTPLIARIIELVQPTLSSTPSAFDLAMVCHAFKAATDEFYELSFAADDERLALERQDYQEARVTIEGSAVLEASGVERAYGMQSPTSVTSDLANHRAQLPWISLGLLECLAIHFQSYVRMQLAKKRVRDARSARLPKLQEACTQMSTQIETEVCSASVMVTRSLIGRLIAWNGLYFLHTALESDGIRIILDRQLRPLDLSSMIECCAVDVTAHHNYALWAARLLVDAAALRKHVGTSYAIDIKSVPPAAARFLDTCMIRASTRMRKLPPMERAPAVSRPVTIGESFQLDGFGHVSCKVVGGKETYQWLALDSFSDYAHEMLTISSGQESLFAFLDIVHAYETRIKHCPKELRFDACPVWANENVNLFKQAIAARYKCVAIIAAGGDHNVIPKLEAAQDPFTRMAEDMLQRAHKEKPFFLRARAYAVQVRNDKCAYDQKATRFHRHHAAPSDVTHYIFGTLCAVLKDGHNSQRAPVGSAERTDNALLIGYESLARKHMLLKVDTQQIIYRKDVQPLNEMVLALVGIPSGGDLATTAMQTDDPAELAPLLAPVQPVQPVPAPIVIRAAYDPIPNGTKLEMGFHDTKSGELRYYGATVRGSTVLPTGKCMTDLAWDDPSWDEDKRWQGKLFDLASQYTPWRLPKPAAPPAPAVRTAPVRASARLAKPVTAALSAALETRKTSAAQIAVCNAIIFQAFGDALDLHVSSLEELDAARQHISDLECSMAQGDPYAVTGLDDVAPLECNGLTLEASKVLKNVVELTAADGSPYTLAVPKGALAGLPDEVEWGLADALGHESVLSHPLNRMVKRKDAKATGAVIAPCVVQRSIKKDPATNVLITRKTRICADGARLKRIMLSQGKEDYAPTHATISDDLQFKMALATAAAGDVQDADGKLLSPLKQDFPLDGTDESLMKEALLIDQALHDRLAADSTLRIIPRSTASSDFKNAYVKAKRLRPVGFLDTVTPMFDDEGDRLCYELGAPIWGEAPAGNEWEQDRNGKMRAAGLTESLEVPGLWYIVDAAVDSRLVIITNVDDLFYTETGNRDYVLTNRVIKSFKGAYGEDQITVKYKPTSWKGYKIDWSKDGSVVTISMAAHAVALALDWVPELLDPNVPTPSDILTGMKLQEACDRLTMQDPRPLKMSPDEKATQQICGGTKYIEQGCMPRMTLMQHRLSCVASGAVQPLGKQVARSLVACIYKHRHEGITYGGNLNLRKTIKGGMYAQLDLADGAPSDIEVHGDATVDDRSVYAAAVTCNGGAVLHMVKKLSTASAINDESSCENESIATSRCSQFAVYARAVATAFGMPPTAPTIIGTDNSANLTLSAGTATPGRAKHALRRWAAIRMRVASGACRVVKVDTDSMPVDFMTKHKGRKLIDASVAYLTNSRNRVESDAGDVEGA